MPHTRAVPVVLSAGERKVLKKRARGARDRATGTGCGRRSCWLLPVAGPAPGSRRTCTSVWTRSASGGAGSPAAAWMAWRTCPGPGGHGGSARWNGPRWSRWPASCPRPPGVPLARWSGPELAAEITKAGLGSPISPSSVLRILAEHPIKPWQYQSWIYPRAPDFAARATVILDLYQGYYQGQPLGPGDRILSADAKPSIQARARRHQTTPPAPGQPMRIEHEYQRKGALALLAALDVRTGGKVFRRHPEPPGSPRSWH